MGHERRVGDIKVVGNRVYLAGGFDYIGRTTGYGVRVDTTSGALGASPEVDGIVRAAAPDGQGGWYLGGDFRKVDTRGRPTLAHIAADGTVSAWAPRPTAWSTPWRSRRPCVVIGGSFTAVNSLPAQNLAMVDRATGASVSAWKASANQPVRALAVSGSGVYVGGDFTTLNGQSRSRLARVSATTGATDATFAGLANGAVRALAVDPTAGVLYAGGDFTTASGGSGYVSRSRLAAFTTTTRARSRPSRRRPTRRWRRWRPTRPAGSTRAASSPPSQASAVPGWPSSSRMATWGPSTPRSAAASCATTRSTRTACLPAHPRSQR